MTIYQWAEEFRKPRHVGIDRLWFGSVLVSTVWLGISHGYNRSKKPLIFESMVFLGGYGGEQEMMRYATKEEAVAGHKELVSKWKKLRVIIVPVTVMAVEKLKNGVLEIVERFQNVFNRKK